MGASFPLDGGAVQLCMKGKAQPSKWSLRPPLESQRLRCRSLGSSWSSSTGLPRFIPLGPALGVDLPYHSALSRLRISAD